MGWYSAAERGGDMTATVSTTPQPALMTAEEFVAKHGGEYVELIDGVVEPIPMPKPLHGRICTKAARFLDEFVEQHQLGAVCSNDTFVLVRRNPDKVRGADVAYWSKAKLPEGRVPEGLIEAPPELCVEVVSPSNTWSDVFIKVGEYLKASVRAVLVLDPESVTGSVYRDNEFQQIFDNGDELTIPDILPGFSVPVRKFFE
jgi:Uma2 family endonuclease